MNFEKKFMTKKNLQKFGIGRGLNCIPSAQRTVCTATQLSQQLAGIRFRTLYKRWKRDENYPPHAGARIRARTYTHTRTCAYIVSGFM